MSPTCPVCKLTYADDFPEDVILHNKRHDMYVNGVFMPPNRKEDVVWSSGNDRVVVIDDWSRNKFRLAASELTRVANKEFGHDMRAFSYYGNGAHCQTRILVYCRGKRGLGFAVTSTRKLGWRGPWDVLKSDARYEITLEDQSPAKTIDVIWVHKKIRGQGVGDLLVSLTAKYYKVSRRDLSWYPPLSDDGERLARKANPDLIWISK